MLQSSSMASTGRLTRPNFSLFLMPKLYWDLPTLHGFHHQLALLLCLTECWQSVTYQPTLEVLLSLWMNARPLIHRFVYMMQIATRIRKGDTTSNYCLVIVSFSFHLSCYDFLRKLGIPIIFSSLYNASICSHVSGKLYTSLFRCLSNCVLIMSLIHRHSEMADLM